MTLEFELNKQIINRVDTEKPVSDSIDYLYAHFNYLSDEWQNKVVTAIFTKNGKSYKMLLDDTGTCLVPWEVVQEGGDVFVSCSCDTLVTATSSRVHIQKSGYVGDGENTQEPTPNIYDQLTGQFQNLKDFVEEELQVIDGGNFEDW